MLARLEPTRAPAPQADVCPQLRAILNRLRFHASFCRASAYLDIYAACQLIGPQTDERTAATTLIRVLSQALDRTPRWNPPGAAAFTFDERWLMQVIEASRTGDADSYTFLTHRRIDKSKRRIFRMLVAALENATS